MPYNHRKTDFITQARELVVKFFNDKSEKTDEFVLELDDVYVVWFSYVLGGWKALISTTLPDGMYYEVTHNNVKHETYLDAYKKFYNVTYPDVPQA